MFESLFGAEMPLALRFFIAFVVVLGLIGVTAYVVRRFGGERLGAATARGRQPRLAVVDSAAVDGRRRLLLIRRDNVEHLLMIGGPTDVVVESTIVRATAAPREPVPPRAPAQPEPRPVPMAEGNMWPLQPQAEPAAPSAPMPAPHLHRPSVQDEPAPWQTEREPTRSPLAPPRNGRPADPLVGLAAELARVPAQPEPGAPASRPMRSSQPQREPMRERQRLEPRVESRAELKPDPMPAAIPEPVFTSATDQNIAEMAHRLEAALRRPPRSKEPQTAEPAAQPEASAAPALTESKPSPQQSETKSSNAEQKPAPSKSLYDSLEQEMASLLGRPQHKS
jgi:flagellar biogenesis protein FliO